MALRDWLSIAGASARIADALRREREENEVRKEVADEVELAYRRRLDENRDDNIQELVDRNIEKKPMTFGQRIKNWFKS